LLFTVIIQYSNGCSVAGFPHKAQSVLCMSDAKCRDDLGQS